MSEINGWNYVQDFFGESEENYWKVLMAKPGESGFEQTYVCEVTYVADTVYLRAFETEHDYNEIEEGENEPKWHQNYDIDTSWSLEEIADQEGVNKRDLDIDNYLNRAVQEIER